MKSTLYKVTATEDGSCGFWRITDDTLPDFVMVALLDERGEIEDAFHMKKKRVPAMLTHAEESGIIVKEVEEKEK
jgi:hypothetical protein